MKPKYLWVALTLTLAPLTNSAADTDANRLTYLDGTDPY